MNNNEYNVGESDHGQFQGTLKKFSKGELRKFALI